MNRLYFGWLGSAAMQIVLSIIGAGVGDEQPVTEETVQTVHSILDWQIVFAVIAFGFLGTILFKLTDRNNR